jgi:predicted nucleic acid-binding protein
MADEMVLIFDAEPLIAFLADEPGSRSVEKWVEQAATGEIRGYISPITKTEVAYVALREGVPEHVVSEFIDRLADNGIETFEAERCWFHAAAFKDEYTIPLGDAFALATARVNDGSVLVGADDDFDEISDEVRVIPFRDEPV